MPQLTNPPKRGAYFKLSTATLAQLDELAKRHGSKAQVVTLAVDRMYQHEAIAARMAATMLQMKKGTISPDDVRKQEDAEDESTPES